MEDRKRIFIERTARFWGVSQPEAVRLLGIKPLKSIRLNSSKDINKTWLELSKLKLRMHPIKWAKNCYTVTNLANPQKVEIFKKTNAVMQNSSSFCPVINLFPKKNDKILDLCSAPGLKSSHISDIAFNMAEVVANELSPQRYKKMQKYFKDYGCNIKCINSDGRSLERNTRYLGYFDKILVDAPCSGEANIDIKDPNSFSSWSIKNIKRLQRLQLSLLKVAYKLVKTGGIIVYSTCTINAEENEIVVSKFIKNHSCLLEKADAGDLPTLILNQSSLMASIENDILNKCVRIIPSQYNEAFFVAKIIKTEEDEFRYIK